MIRAFYMPLPNCTTQSIAFCGIPSITMMWTVWLGFHIFERMNNALNERLLMQCFTSVFLPLTLLQCLP